MIGGRAHTEEVTVFADVPLAIDPDEVLRFQGYKRGIDVPTPDVLALFDEALALGRTLIAPSADRKSTRLNSSHLVISYAVFCLKKKKHDQNRRDAVRRRRLRQLHFLQPDSPIRTLVRTVRCASEVDPYTACHSTMPQPP